MRNMFVTSILILLGIAGCTKCNSPIWSGEGVECQRLRLLWERMGKENPQIIIPETETESGEEFTWQELGEMIFFAVGCCSSRPNALAKEWTEYNRLECVRQYLEKENIQKISFCDGFGSEFIQPKDWHSWAEITEPEKIKETIKLLCEAMKKEKNRFANEVSFGMEMQIITDKHKFIIPISCQKKAVYGIGWTSYELRKKLAEWGFPVPK